MPKRPMITQYLPFVCCSTCIITLFFISIILSETILFHRHQSYSPSLGYEVKFPPCQKFSRNKIAIEETKFATYVECCNMTHVRHNCLR